MQYEIGVLKHRYSKPIVHKVRRLDSMPSTIRSLYRMTVINIHKAPIVIEAPTLEQFNLLAAKFGAQADRVKETQPFARFLFVAYATYERETYQKERIDIPVIIFYDLGTDAATWLTPRFYIPQVNLTEELG